MPTMPTITCNGKTVELLREHWKMPTLCPCCRTPVVKDPQFVAYYCPNTQCPEQVFQRLQHAVAKSALDMDGCGDALLRELIAGGVNNLVDLFKVSPTVIQGNAARAKFIKSRAEAKAQPLWRKLHALGIELVGKTLCKELAAIGSIEDIFAPENFSVTVPEILGDVRYKNFKDYALEHADEIEQLDALITFRDPKKQAGALTGQVFVITGSMLSGSRDQVSKKIEDAGGVVKGSVSRGVHYLIMGEGAGNTKANAAKKLGTQVITEEDLYLMLNEPMPTGTDVSDWNF